MHTSKARSGFQVDGEGGTVEGAEDESGSPVQGAVPRELCRACRLWWVCRGGERRLGQSSRTHQAPRRVWQPTRGSASLRDASPGRLTARAALGSLGSGRALVGRPQNSQEGKEGVSGRGAQHVSVRVEPHLSGAKATRCDRCTASPGACHRRRPHAPNGSEPRSETRDLSEQRSGDSDRGDFETGCPGSS